MILLGVAWAVLYLCGAAAWAFMFRKIFGYGRPAAIGLGFSWPLLIPILFVIGVWVIWTGQPLD